MRHAEIIEGVGHSKAELQRTNLLLQQQQQASEDRDPSRRVHVGCLNESAWQVPQQPTGVVGVVQVAACLACCSH